METLLAKRRNVRGSSVTLLQHLVDTEHAVGLVFAEGSRWQRAWVRFFKIPEAQAPLLWKTVRVAALLHDIGKANHDFQEAVTKPGAPAQSVRHEHLSALVLCHSTFRQWLLDGGVDPDVVTAAVLSHHIKAAAQHELYAWCQSRGRSSVELFLAHADVRAALSRVASLLGAEAAPTLPAEAWSSSPPWSLVYDSGRRAAETFRRALKKEQQRARRRFLSAVKAGLVVADAVASGTVREGKPMQEWLAENAHSPAVSPEEVDSAILAPRAREVERRAGRPFSLHSFQKLAGMEGARTLLVAPCGAGKTLAAWEWAKQQATRREFGRVIFLYPTRGTATEGFRDYVGWAPEGDATLLHASSAFELASMNDNPAESLRDKDLSTAEAEARMFALGLWRFRFFSATVDQFLSFMQNRYQSLCLLPALADAAIVLDEVHSYDSTMFELLLSFLREFDVPVLCMTATVPPSRMQRLLGAGLTVFPRSEHQEQLVDLADTALHPRYLIRYELDAETAVAAGIRGYREGKRVLLVVNRVARCLEIARQIENDLGFTPMVYHSRFRLVDRQARHRDVVDAFKGSEPAIAVTTQVCEMSLDLDAELLVTEVAPVPSLIQRFGRANRHLKDPSVLASVVVYPPAKPAPYSREDLEVATRFVKSVVGVATQSALAKALERREFAAVEPELNDDGRFLDGGYFALPGSFRDEDASPISCVCDGDLEEVTARYRERAPIDGYLVPAPRKRTIAVETALPPHIGVVSSTDYSPRLGLQV